MQQAEQRQQKATEPVADKAQQDKVTEGAAKDAAQADSVKDSPVKEGAPGKNQSHPADEESKDRDQLSQSMAEHLAAGEAMEVTGVQSLQPGIPVRRLW